MNLPTFDIPTLALLAALIAVFGTLWLEWRSHPANEHRLGELPTARQRHLLWLLGWFFLVVQLAVQVSRFGARPSGQAVSLDCMELGALMFLGSLAAQYFTVRPKILYVTAFGAPLVLYATLSSLDSAPDAAVRTMLFVCLVVTLVVGARWSLHRNLVPEWLSLSLVLAVGAGCAWLTYRGEYSESLSLVHSGILLMTAMLFASAFRRATTGVLFTVGGLAVWSVPGILRAIPATAHPRAELLRAIDLVKVLTALGMIVLVLEDEIASNQAAQQRDRRARREMEKYNELFLDVMPVDEGGGRYDRVCETIVEASRFAQAAIFVRNAGGTYRLAGHAGIPDDVAGALNLAGARLTDEKAAEVTSSRYMAREIGHLMQVDLTPVVEASPGMVLTGLNYRQSWMIGIRVRDGGWQGALLLGGLREPGMPLRTDDVLPLELLVARIGAAREQVGLLRRLMHSERLAGLGQLAGGVAHELNNPLTAVTGFAELLSDHESAGVRDRAQVILGEARRMKKIIESLVRFRKVTPDSRGPVSVELLLRDIEKLARHDLESTRVDLQLKIPDGLPRVTANEDQIRQVFLQIVKNAITAFEEMPAEAERRLSVEVAGLRESVRIQFADTGPGFSDPGRAFDPFFTTRNPGEGFGLGLSLCYSIIREHGGEISAANLEPRGAAVTIELPREAVESVAESAAQPRGGKARGTGARDVA
ncbi:MAG TPA: HAMP domain-containing sensor histidine kinase [Acidobacteriaceae bacterium]|nr:HAMP domain-containing sensor histidine kinase [Acidobacteriaceae bacterium]